MVKIDSQAIFGDSPAELEPQSWVREKLTKTFPGLDGELIIDLGKRSRKIIQTGKLIAGTISTINNQIEQIENLIDSNFHTLIDNHSRVFNRVQIENFTLKTPLKTGNGYHCKYEIVYRQQPGE